MMRQGISIAAMIAMLAQGPAMAVPPEQSQLRSSPSGLCRTPAALPQLDAESWNQQQPQRPVPMPASTSRRGDYPTAEPVAAPPPPPPAMAREESADIIVSESSADMSKRDAVPVAGAMRSEAKVMPGEVAGRPERMPPGPQPRPQVGQLTAGEHDDLLNPELYAQYQRHSNLGQELPGLPLLDTARVLTVEAKDRSGRPLGQTTVEVECADGNRLRLSTLSDGTVALFPALDRLGSKVRVRVGAEPWRDVTIASGGGGQRVSFTLDQGQAQDSGKLDLMLVIDTTGSMGDEIRYLQTELAAITSSIRARHPGLDLRIGFVVYRDLGDDYVTQTVPLTRDFARAQGELGQHWAGGGGDYPEAMDQALVRAAGQDWRGDAVKTMLLVADAPPHDEHIGLAWQASEVLRAKRVQIVPIAASGVADKAEYVMRAMAALTQSRYTFLTDDSGIGNAHAAPAIDCYLVTRLDALLRRVIDSQLSGRRIEPADQEVIRTVGDYDHGRCVIPRGGLQQD